jgi:hypothetical protein
MRDEYKLHVLFIEAGKHVQWDIQIAKRIRPYFADYFWAQSSFAVLLPEAAIMVGCVWSPVTERSRDFLRQNCKKCSDNINAALIISERHLVSVQNKQFVANQIIINISCSLCTNLKTVLNYLAAMPQRMKARDQINHCHDAKPRDN